MNWPLVETRESFRELHEFLKQREEENMADYVLPYPSQLPQDYYAKGLPSPAPPSVTPPLTPIPVPPPELAPPTINSGGVYYGPTPPASPQYGWLWTMGQGRLFVYMEPGVWTQVSTNW